MATLPPLPPCPDTSYTNETVPGTTNTPESINTASYNDEVNPTQMYVIASNCVNEELLAAGIIYDGQYLYDDEILYDGVTVL
jgi:hypothetical protein